MSYFPCDIPHMPHDELEENGINIPKDECGVEMNDGLKPCPFCGGKAKTYMRQFKLFSTCCCDTKCIGHNLYIMFRSEKESIESWNRRDGED